MHSDLGICIPFDSPQLHLGAHAIPWAPMSRHDVPELRDHNAAGVTSSRTRPLDFGYRVIPRGNRCGNCRLRVGAGNSAVVVDLPRCGPMLIRRVPNLVPIPGVAGSAHCAVRSLEGHRDNRVAPPTRRVAPTGRPTRDHRRRPDLARGDRGCATATEPSRVAGHPRHTVALAPAPHRRALGSTTATAGPAIDLSEASPTRAAPRSGESDLGIPPHPWRARRARPPPCCVHGLADPQQRRNRPGPHTLQSHPDQPDRHLQVVKTAGCGGLINEYRNAA